MSIPAVKTKTPQKTKQKQNLTENQTMLNTKISAKRGPVLTFSLQGGADPPLAPHLRQFHH